MDLCEAGRTAFFGGRWQMPCPDEVRHRIANPGREPIGLCDEHFNQVNSAGLVSDPNIGKAEYQRRERERTGKQRGIRSWFRRD